MKAFHKNILKKERWVDIRKFVSKGKRELSNGLFEIFGNYSDEPSHTVRDNLLGWIYDNFRKIETWFSIALKQKGVSLSEWAESMRNPKQPGDELCLYLLCRMYRKHALIHLKHHWWSTIQHPLPGDLNEILEQCHLELVFIREWVFGEVKQIRKLLSTCASSPKPLGIMDQSMNMKISEANLEHPVVSTTSVQVKTPVVITENASVSKPYETKECNVCIERLPVTMSTSASATNSCLAYNMRTRPPKAETPHRTSNRPCTIVDYSKFMTGTEDDTSPPPQKKCTVDLKRTPSSSRIASQNFHTKPSTAPQLIRRKEPSTIMKAASSKETKVAIEALLSLGNDVIPENDITAENSALVPIGINAPPIGNDNDIDNVKDSQNDVSNQPTPSAPIPAPAQAPQLECTNDDLIANKDTTESTDSQTTSSDAVPAKKEKKGTLVTKNFTLPRRARPTRSFK